MVEFALVVPLLLLLVVGIAEFGRAYHIQTTLSGAAREGVRVMALNNDPGDARTTTKSAASTLNLTDGQISITPTDCAVTPSSPDATATVTVTYPLSSMTGLIPFDIDLTGTGVMRCNG